MTIGELGCPSLEYVYEMTWSEFLIRLHSYNRQEERQWMKVRELAWITYMAPHQDPKKIKKSIKSFWPLTSNKKKSVDVQREMMIAAQKKYVMERAKNKIKNGE